MTERSLCQIEKVSDTSGIVRALGAARAQGLTVIAHAAGHSYTDAALNTNGLIVDVTAMRRIQRWDPGNGIMQVEPGVTLREMVQVSQPNGWWPAISPSTADATIGGCVAMNVTGKNAWQCGSFGEQLLSLTLLLASGEVLTVSPVASPELFRAVVGSAGLLGVITSLTLQLRRIASASVDVRRLPADNLGELLEIFAQERHADFLEGWVDGFTTGVHLGRGFVTSSNHSDDAPARSSRAVRQLQGALLRWAGSGARFALNGSVRIANSAAYRWSNHQAREGVQRQSLFDSTYFAPDAYAAFRNLLPRGIETFHAFVPRSQAQDVFREMLLRSQTSHCVPLWCVMKQHRRDPFLLSYQVDGYSLELNYARHPRTLDELHRLLRELMDTVIGAGGRFYLAKDSLLTATLYRRSMGDEAVDAFLRLKQQLDPGMLFQSNLFRRVFQPEP